VTRPSFRRLDARNNVNSLIRGPIKADSNSNELMGAKAVSQIRMTIERTHGISVRAMLLRLQPGRTLETTPVVVTTTTNIIIVVIIDTTSS